MKNPSRFLINVLGPVLLLGSLAGCSPNGELESEVQGSPSPDVTQEAEGLIPSAGVISQWGESAEASSEFANPEWSASQAVGIPDAPGCGDYQFAWASAGSDAIETLKVSFRSEVFPLEIFIHQSFNPDQVVKVEVLNSETGAYYTVHQKNPIQIDRPCPYVLEVAVKGIDFKTDQIRITVDQSQLGLGWNEIDAVQLVGSFQIEEQ
jgi:hypothetical protein